MWVLGEVRVAQSDHLILIPKLQETVTPPPSSHQTGSNRECHSNGAKVIGKISIMVRIVGRSTMVKQFLLRVHPDHFRTIPKVHDENLQSIQLLNQFIDDQASRVSKKQVFFSAFIPSAAEPQGKLKRFPLELETNIEVNMRRILKECGVDVPDADTNSTDTNSSGSTGHRATWDFDFASRGAGNGSSNGGMDFGSSDHFANFARTRRTKRKLITLSDFLAYAHEPEAQQRQTQTRLAWQSIESIKSTLQREFGLADVTTSCGWASVPLNKTLLTLLKTLRKGGLKDGDSDRLRDVRLDLSTDPSEIDYFNEYTMVLNVADVPLQWVEALTKIDATMLQYIHQAKLSLQQLQRDAERTLGGRVTVVRGKTCSAIAYRGFLQDMVTTAPPFMDDPQRQEDARGDHHLIDKVAVVVEDTASMCEILDDGRVRVPSHDCVTLLLEFLDAHRSQIQDQVHRHAVDVEQFEWISRQCVAALGLASFTHADGLRLSDVNQAASRLLQSMTMHGHQWTSMRGQAIRIDRFFGLSHDGVFTVPVDWR